MLSNNFEVVISTSSGYFISVHPWANLRDAYNYAKNLMVSERGCWIYYKGIRAVEIDDDTTWSEREASLQNVMQNGSPTYYVHAPNAVKRHYPPDYIKSYREDEWTVVTTRQENILNPKKSMWSKIFSKRL